MLRRWHSSQIRPPLASAAPSQGEAFHIIETQAEGGEEELGWEEAGPGGGELAVAEEEEDGCGLDAYAALESVTSERVRGHTLKRV